MVRRVLILKSNNYRKRRSSMIFEPKEEKKISFSFKSVKYILGLGIIIYLVYFVLFSQQFYIKDILVEGSDLVPKDQIIAEVPRQNIFRLDIIALKAKLINDFPEVREVEIFRGIPDALKIVVNERDGKMVWQSGDKKYLVSSQGEITRQVVGTEGDGLPLVADKKALPVKPGEKLLSSNLVAFVVNIYNGISDAVNVKPDHFEVNETTFDLNLYTDAGFYVKLNSLRSSKKQLDNLKLVMIDKRSEIHEYVDLRIDGWAYYK